MRTTLRTQKIISAVAIGLTVVFGLQALAYILNLNQVNIFLNLAFWFWIYLAVIMAFWYDLHFKNPGALARAQTRHENIQHWLNRSSRVLFAAFWERIEHFRRWSYFSQWQNYLLLPGLTFWATAAMVYLNFGYIKMQQIFILLSSAAMILNFWYLKEVFYRKTEAVEHDIFVALSVVKIYTAGILFGAGMGLMRRYCLDGNLYALLVFCLTFLLVYQALFQHRLINLINIGWTLLISSAMAGVSFFVYRYWGYNFYTAAILLTVFYNLFWGIFHYHLDRSLTKRAFFEILIVSIAIAIMVLQVTNFKARILGECL